jgi:hypothetical protein
MGAAEHVCIEDLACKVVGNLLLMFLRQGKEILKGRRGREGSNLTYIC